MKKNTIKAFTLVEMLIVIVIIGILIASLMPRMQTAQGRARDVARKNDLSQIETAIITSQADRGEWPGMGNNKTASLLWWTSQPANANVGIVISLIEKQLTDAGMTAVPKDPNGSNDNFGIWTAKAAANDDTNFWEYLYMVWKRNWVADAWFALMAKTEVEWSSNWVVCNTAWTATDAKKLSGNKWYIQSTDDLSNVHLCKKVSKWTAGTCSVADAENCIYEETWELRYLLVY